MLSQRQRGRLQRGAALHVPTRRSGARGAARRGRAGANELALPRVI